MFPPQQPPAQPPGVPPQQPPAAQNPQAVANIKTPQGRVSFPYLFTRSRLSGKFEITLVFSKDTDLSILYTAAQQCAVEKWGQNIPVGLKTPFRYCHEKPQFYGEDFDPMDIFVAFRSDRNQPGVVDAAVQPIMDQSEIYPGCWARVSCNPYSYSHSGNNGVSFGLINVQKVMDDNPIAGSNIAASDDFGPVAGSPHDPAAYGAPQAQPVFGQPSAPVQQPGQFQPQPVQQQFQQPQQPGPLPGVPGSDDIFK